MNDDHVQNMHEMCEGMYGLRPGSVRMERVERDGFFLRTTEPDRLLFFPFRDEVGATSLRQAVVGVLQRAREEARKLTARHIMGLAVETRVQLDWGQHQEAPCPSDPFRT